MKSSEMVQYSLMPITMPTYDMRFINQFIRNFVAKNTSVDTLTFDSTVTIPRSRNLEIGRLLHDLFTNNLDAAETDVPSYRRLREQAEAAGITYETLKSNTEKQRADKGKPTKTSQESPYEILPKYELPELKLEETRHRRRNRTVATGPIVQDTSRNGRSRVTSKSSATPLPKGSTSNAPKAKSSSPPKVIMDKDKARDRYYEFYKLLGGPEQIVYAAVKSREAIKSARAKGERPPAVLNIAQHSVDPVSLLATVTTLLAGKDIAEGTLAPVGSFKAIIDKRISGLGRS